MSDAQREQQWRALGQVLQRPSTSLEDTAFEAEVRRLHRRRKTTRRAVAVTAALLVMSVAGVALIKRSSVIDTPSLASVRIASDASFTAAVGAHVRTRATEPGLLWLELERDSARFDVAPQGGRLVRVTAGDVDVEVIGTAFVVTRSTSDVSVKVTEGKVRVRHGERESLLVAGESGAWPLVLAKAAPVPVPEPEVLPEPEAEPIVEARVAAPVVQSKKPHATKPKVGSSRWRALAESGDYGGAWTALQGEGQPDDEPPDLLRAADVARLSGHPAQAVPPLRRILAHFPNDPRASLAAFTLGRVLLDDLGNPREAADAFLKAWALAPKSPLAPSAGARAVEALSRAGDDSAAREVAERYVREFPQSGRVDAVKRWGKVP